MNSIKKWWTAPAYCWQFWMPRSGFVGGCLGALVMMVLYSTARWFFQ